MDTITVQALTTITGLALVTGLIVPVIRKVLALSGEVMDRFGAVLSIGVAVVLALLAGIVLGATDGVNLFQDALNGLVAGLAAAGGYDVVNGAAKAARNE